MDSNNQEREALFQILDDFVIPLAPLYIIEKLYPLTLLLSTAISIYMANWEIFQRAGAIIVALSILSASQTILNRIKMVRFSSMFEIIEQRVSTFDNHEEVQKSLRILEKEFYKEPLHDNLTNNFLKTSVRWAIIGTLINGFGDLLQIPWELLINTLPSYEPITSTKDSCIDFINNKDSWICGAFRQL